ncbi:DNA/RNA non-specific endonuclease, partial [Acinetobacter baumannii]|uniref:DNA/RNA non-specific endonuclease n=1 Tax=Acinetobacter baumannii TaxID=470 RepID=UPI0025AEF2B8
MLCNAAFALQTNPSSRTPLWTAHRLTPGSVQAARGTVRSAEFFEDSRVSSQFRAILSDYRRSGYDRGHMV